MEEASTGELIRKAVVDVEELARAEVALAVRELGAEARDALVASVTLSMSIALGFAALALVAATVVVVLGGSTTAAFGCAAALLAVAGATGFAVSIGKWPKRFLPDTRRRVARDIAEVKEHVS